MRGNACLIKPSKLAERRLLIAWNCTELRLPIAWKCAELQPANAWKCAEPRFAWECELRGRLQTAARVRGTRVGSAREVRLKCGSSAWNRGSTHWWVPYFYGTGTLRVKNIHIAFVVVCLVMVILIVPEDSGDAFIHILHDCFTGTGAIMWLPQCQWSNPEGYGKINQYPSITNSTKCKLYA